MKTPITYYGGKQAMINYLLELVPEHEVYTEVFFGGGTLFFAKNPDKNETINDKLDIVINFYQQLKSNFTALKKKIEASLISRTQFNKSLSMLKNKKNYTNLDLAWAFWYCCNVSYYNKIGSGIRYSDNQHTLVNPVLRHKKEQFTELLVKRIENAQIENTDALKILKKRDFKDAFHYIDPPYMGADQGHYKGYTEKDFIKLLNVCSKLKGKFLLSNYESDILNQYIEKYNWNKKEIINKPKAPIKSGTKKKELLVWNYTINNMQLELFN